MAVGRTPGVYRTMDEVREQTNGLPLKGPDKGKMKIFANEADAEQYVQRWGRAVSPEAAAAPRRLNPVKKTFFVAIGGSRPGVYDFEKL